MMNVITFLLMGSDKKKAKKHSFRIPEKVLLGLACCGGSIGCFCGMLLFHHKTKKILFKFGIPLILFLQFLLCIYLESRSFI